MAPLNTREAHRRLLFYAASLEASGELSFVGKALLKGAAHTRTSRP